MKWIQDIEDKTNLATRTTSALRFTVPPFLPFTDLVVVGAQNATIDNQPISFTSLKEKIANGSISINTTAFVCPLELSIESDGEDDGYVLPVDPVIAISGKNILVRRYPAKGSLRGSIKERWSQDDWEVTISGVMIGVDNYTINDQLKKLMRYIEAGESITVTCPLLQDIFDIQRIAIETYDFPFTPGENNQAFVIKSYSDDYYTLLEEVKNV